MAMPLRAVLASNSLKSTFGADGQLEVSVLVCREPAAGVVVIGVAVVGAKMVELSHPRGIWLRRGSGGHAHHVGHLILSE